MPVCFVGYFLFWLVPDTSLSLLLSICDIADEGLKVLYYFVMIVIYQTGFAVCSFSILFVLIFSRTLFLTHH